VAVGVAAAFSTAPAGPPAIVSSLPTGKKRDAPGRLIAIREGLRRRAAERQYAYVFKRAAFTVDLSRTPKASDTTPLDPELPAEARQAFGAIYLLDGNELWIAGDTGTVGRDDQGRLERPRNYDLSVGIAYPLRVLVLRRVPEKGGGRE
jgi:hypothetical protein